MKIVIVTLWSLLLFAGSNQLFAIAGNMGGGSGTAEKPYLIEDIDDFDEFAANSEYWTGGAYTTLRCDIDLSGRIYNKAIIAPDTDNATWGIQPISYQGVFEGNGKIISNMYIDTQDTENCYLGLFGGIATGGIIQNLTISSYTITSNNTSNHTSNMGGICGIITEGAIKNCHTTGSISGIKLAKAGGLCGNSESSNIQDSSAAVTINAGIYAQSIGGFCGSILYGSVSNCQASGSITVDMFGSYLGGFTGGNVCSTNDCKSITSITCKKSSTHIGGFCGANTTPDGNIKKCHANGDITTGDHCEKIGGFCGNNTGTISLCYSKGSIDIDYFSSHIGGFTGMNSISNQPGIIQDCYATCSITGTQDIYAVGGFIGENENNIFSSYENLIINCYSTGSIAITSGNMILGFGQTEHKSENCFWDTDSSGIADSYSNHNGLPYGLSTEQMQMASTFINAGWDFVNLWTIGENQTYPVLRKAPGTDINGDGIVNLFDLQLLAASWLNQTN